MSKFVILTNFRILSFKMISSGATMSTDLTIFVCNILELC